MRSKVLFYLLIYDCSKWESRSTLYSPTKIKIMLLRELSFPTVLVLNKITPKYYKMVQILRLNMCNYMRAH